MLAHSSIFPPPGCKISGTFPPRCSLKASIAVMCERIKEEIKMTSTGIEAIACPASSASCIPFLLKGISTHPVKRSSRFHSDSPCRSKINFDALPILQEHSTLRLNFIQVMLNERIFERERALRLLFVDLQAPFSFSQLLQD